MSDRCLFGRYTKRRLLGSGSYGQVWSCEDRRGRHYAVKCMHLSDPATVHRGPDFGLPPYVGREIRALSSIRAHPNVIPLLHHYHDAALGMVGLVFPLESDGDLYGYLQTFRRLKQRLPLSFIQSLATQLLRGIAHIHSHGIIHRDLKPSNVLLNLSTGNIKIIDFGLCRFVSENREALSMEAFTRMYRPPEVLLGDGSYLREAVDIWSVGAIVAELFILHPIFRSISPELMTFGKVVSEDESDFGQVSLVGGGNATTMFVFGQHECICGMPQWKPPPAGDPRHLRSRLEIRGRIGDDAYDFVEKMLSMDPCKRPTARQLLRHPFLSGAVTVPLLPVAEVKRIQDDGWEAMVRAPPCPVVETVDEHSTSGSSAEQIRDRCVEIEMRTPLQEDKVTPAVRDGRQQRAAVR